MFSYLWLTQFLRDNWCPRAGQIVAATNTAPFPSTVDGQCSLAVVCRGGASTHQPRNLNCFLWWDWDPGDSFSIICEFLTASAQQGGMHGHQLAQPSRSQCLAQMGITAGLEPKQAEIPQIPAQGKKHNFPRGWWAHQRMVGHSACLTSVVSKQCYLAVQVWRGVR